MKLLQAKKFLKIINESVGAGNLYRIMELAELEDILSGEWQFTGSDGELEDLEQNENPKIKDSEVYRKSKEYQYWKALTRTVNPYLIEWFFNPINNIIVEFNQQNLKNIRSVNQSPIVYNPYSVGSTDEMEERLWSNSKYNMVNQNIIEAIFITPQLLKKYKNIAKILTEMNIPFYILPEYKTLAEYARNVNNLSLKHLKENS